jgi:hypothetical protein
MWTLCSCESDINDVEVRKTAMDVVILLGTCVCPCVFMLIDLAENQNVALSRPEGSTPHLCTCMHFITWCARVRGIGGALHCMGPFFGEILVFHVTI